MNNTVTNALTNSFRGSQIRPSIVVSIKGGNFVGALMEFCDAKSIKKPDYEMESEITTVEGGKQFVIQCTLPNLSASGMASSKRVAKQKAAENMLKLVKEKLKEFIDKETYDEYYKN